MGRQFANDSMTPSPISVSRDKYDDEIPSDRPEHENTTPGMTASLYTGGHYADDFPGGYGKSVEDKGQSPSKEKVDADVHGANRGKAND